MKKNYRFCTISLLALALAACTNDDLQDNPLADGPVPLNVTADISAVATRASIDSEGSASFTAGNTIRVVDNNQVRYDYSLQADGTWDAGDNPYYFQSTASVNFRAWYAPDGAIASGEGGVITIDTKKQITDNAGWNQWDILATPQVTASVSAPSINFTGDDAFQHVMSRVAFTFKAGTDDGITDLGPLSGYTLKSVITGATFSELTCTLTPGPGSETGDIAVTGITDATGTEYNATPLIVVPQNPNGNVSLEVTYNDQTYKASLTPPEGGLQAGYSYTYTVTVKNSVMKVSNATISGWKTDLGHQSDGDATLQ